MALTHPSAEYAATAAKAFAWPHASSEGLVRALESSDGVRTEDVSMTRMVGLLQKFGTGPALPTAMFPCDKSSTSSAIAEMAWRLKRASSMLDEGGDDLDSRLASLFLCTGIIVVTRPDTLR